MNPENTPNEADITKLEHIKSLHKLCEKLQQNMEDYVNNDLIFDDIKDINKLDALLKVRTRLIEFDKKVKDELALLTPQSQEDAQEERKALIQQLLVKIAKAGQTPP